MEEIIATLPRQERKVFELLLSGGRFSTADFAIRLHLCDPRGRIASLRKRGIPIADVWVQSANNVRYKLYFLKR